MLAGEYDGIYHSKIRYGIFDGIMVPRELGAAEALRSASNRGGINADKRVKRRVSAGSGDNGHVGGGWFWKATPGK